MPCRTDHMYDPPSTNTVPKEKYNQLLAEANLTTKLLCAIEKKLDKELLFHVIEDIPGVKEWFAKHAEEDYQRTFKDIKSKFPHLNEAQISKLIATGVFEEEPK